MTDIININVLLDAEVDMYARIRTTGNHFDFNVEFKFGVQTSQSMREYLIC